MDDRSHRIVNRILGNAEHAASLECTVLGPTLRFLSDTTIALGGAVMEAKLDGIPPPYWRKVAVKAGQLLTLGRITGPGMRTYLAVEGGFDAPSYLESRSAFALGGFGGHSTGAIRGGDMLRIGKDRSHAPMSGEPAELTRFSGKLGGLSNAQHIATSNRTRGMTAKTAECECRPRFKIGRRIEAALHREIGAHSGPVIRPSVSS